MSTIGETIRHEIRELIPAVIYFVITFNMIGFTKVLMLRDYGITVSTFVGATLGALLVAKAVLIVGVLPFMEPFRKIPILYNVLWKTLLYMLAAFMIQVLEEIIRSLLKHGGLALRGTCCCGLISGGFRSGWSWCFLSSAPFEN
jgi:hypothetical protein